jgi:uncharacterized membrane protein
MFIAFIPFSTALIGEYRDQEVSIIVYGINIIIVLVFGYLQWEYATKERHLVDIDLDPNLVTITSRRIFVGMILYAFGIVFSFLNTQVSLALFILIPLYYLMPKKYFLIRSTKNK